MAAARKTAGNAKKYRATRSLVIAVPAAVLCGALTVQEPAINPTKRAAALISQGLAAGYAGSPTNVATPAIRLGSAHTNPAFHRCTEVHVPRLRTPCTKAAMKLSTASPSTPDQPTRF